MAVAAAVSEVVADEDYVVERVAMVLRPRERRVVLVVLRAGEVERGP